MSAIGSINQTFSPGPNTLVAGRDFALNDRIALNTAAATGKNIYFPNTGKPYSIDGPAYLCGFSNAQTVSGEPSTPVQYSGIGEEQAGMGVLTTPVISGTFMGPVVVLTNPNNFGGVESGTYVNLGSYLDSSCNASTRYGLRTFAGAQRGSFCSDGFQLGGARSVGDWWQGSTYTISFAFLPYNSGSPSNPFVKGAGLIGFGSGWPNGGNPFPWNLQVQPINGVLTFMFLWIDENTPFGGTPYEILWPYPSVTNVVRLYIMFDINRTQFSQNVTIYQDTGSGPVQVAYQTGYSKGVQGVPMPRSFYYPFSFGWLSPSYNTNGPGHADDWVMCGLHVENALSYKDNGSGTLVTQAGAAITDEYAFFTPRSSTAALLPLTYQGSPYAWEIPTQNLSVGGFGFLFGDSAGGAFGAGLRNLTVANGAAPVSVGSGIGYGEAIAIMNADDLTIENISASAGASAVRSWPQTTTIYYQRYLNLQLYSGVPIIATNANLNIHNVEMHIANNGIGIYTVGSVINIHQGRFPSLSPNAKNIIWLDNGYGASGPGGLWAEDLINDNEGQQWPTDSYIRVNFSLFCVITKSYLGSIYAGGKAPLGAPGLALGMLIPSEGAKANCSLDSAFMNGTPTFGSSLVRVEDPGWDVRIVGINSCAGVHGMLHDVSSGGCTAHVEQLDCGPVPPRYGHAYQGMHLSRCNPVAGQFSEWRCVQSGSYGTATIPYWTGHYPVGVPGTNQCAGYCLTYLSVVNPAFDTAFLYDVYVNSLIEYLFGQAAFTPTSVNAFGYLSALWSRWPTAIAYTVEAFSGEIQSLSALNPQFINGGTYTLSYNGTTTSTLAWNASLAAIQSALAAIGANVTMTNPGGGTYLFNAQGGIFTFTDNIPHPLISINTSLLTGYNSPFSATIVQTQAGGSYARVAVTWTTPANGSSSNATAVTPPTSTGPWNDGVPVSAWHLNSATSGGSYIFSGTLASPFAITESGYVPASFAIGSLTIQGTASAQGGMTNYAIDQILGAILQGTAFTPPTDWYIGLSSTPINASGAGLTEPSGSGYARVSIANTSTNWKINQFGGRSLQGSMAGGFACNVNAITFPTPTAAWSSGVSLPYWFLADASTSGNIWAYGTIPVAPVVSGSTSPAPSFAPGSFAVQLI